MARIDAFLRHVKEHKGSDLHCVAGIEPRLRARGLLSVVEGSRSIPDAELRSVLREIASEDQWKAFERDLELDFAYSLPGIGRFRVNYFNQASGAAAVFRLIPEEIASLKELNMPATVERFAHLRSGLVLVTGPTGSGKSTTLASMIDTINEHYSKHIITIEDPIEFVHKGRQSMFSQREIGPHVESFEAALRAAMRQNPDVIMVGEMRGQEVELAISAAEMGALVFGTLHTNSATKTIDRLIDIFPTDRQEQIRISLAEALAGVISQLLLPTADGTGRIAAVELLVKTSGLPNIIREGNTPQLLSMLQGGKQYGMQTMDEALEGLVRSGKIRPKDAYQRAVDKVRFEQLLNAPLEGD
jgi:twitching motility protein PilT